MADTPLQTAAAAPAVDPNVMLAGTPDTSTAPGAAASPKQTAAQEQESFVDEWAKDPTGTAPVRTWVDPTKRTGPDGEFLSAWYDQTPVDQNTQSTATAFDPNANAAAIGNVVGVRHQAIVDAQAAAQAAADAEKARQQAEANQGVGVGVGMESGGDGPGGGPT